MSKKVRYTLLLIVTLTLFLLPFIWFSPSQVDFGGDSGRLYFLDPYAFFINASLYPQVPGGTGVMLPAYYHIPYISLLLLLHNITHSPWVVNNIFNGIKLAIAFISVFLIVLELGNGKEESKSYTKLFVASLLAGLFYVLTPSMTGNMERALLSHNQIFLNPLMFLLLLKFFIYHRYFYGWLALGVSVIFAPNFGFPAMPAFFAFYPLAILFIFLYVIFIKQKNISIRQTGLFLLTFFGLHSFHLIPQVSNLLEPQSYVNMRLFDSKTIVHEGVQYFIAVLPLAKASNNFFYTLDESFIRLLSGVVIATIVVGLLLNNRKNKTLLLIAVFFLLTFFLMTAKITAVGVELYKSMYYVPGFSMFRNFIGQWQFVYAFFYALLFGCSLHIVLKRASAKVSWILAGVVVCALLVVNKNFLNGSVVNKLVNDTSGYRTGIEFDPSFSKTMTYFKENPYDFKILSLPFSDCCYQVIKGKNFGAYIGTTPIAHLTGKNDYTGYQTINPFADAFLQKAKERDYKTINQLLALLNVEYIYHNSDPKIYDTTFPKQPYEYVRQSLPSTQKGYEDFIENLGASKVYENGPHKVYKVANTYNVPHIYSPQEIVVVDSPKTLLKNISESKSSYVALLMRKDCIKLEIADGCDLKLESSGAIFFKKINRTKYLVRIDNAPEKMMLIFSEAYHPGWKLYPTTPILKDVDAISYNDTVLQGKKNKDAIDSEWWKNMGVCSSFDKTHVLINGYANGWVLDNHIKKPSQNFILEFEDQRIFYISGIISLGFLVFYVLQGLVLVKKKILV